MEFTTRCRWCCSCCAAFLLWAAIFCSVQAGPSARQERTSSANISKVCNVTTKCNEGVLLPVWYPQNPSLGDKVARAIVYFVALIYMFLGVSIVADRFMASIEVISSQEREITIKRQNGETTKTTVRIWNETVSNLTLMALGSSAPEILLSIIEICGHGFKVGELGPSTIVGSAAFNMFMIIAICVYSIPEGETRKIKHLCVFFVTSGWSIFAYIWLYLIVSQFSPGIVEIWEALITFLFFPLCVTLAWVADRRLLFYKYMYKRYHSKHHRGIIIETEGERPKAGIEMDGKMSTSAVEEMVTSLVENDNASESRREMIRILKELKQKHPEKDMDQLVEMANYQALIQQQKSRAFYRIQATRMMTGAGNILKKHAADQARKESSLHEISDHSPTDDFCAKVFFEPCSYVCLENCGSCVLTIVRRDGELSESLCIKYKTEDGTAKAGSDYEYSEGSVTFKPGETQREISIGIIDDDIFEEDEHFFVRLYDLHTSPEPNAFGSNDGSAGPIGPLAQLVAPYVATVTIFDDDHAGIFTFEDRMCHVSESIGLMEVRVLRTSGARGTVIVPYKTIEGTAKGGGDDFEDSFGELEFQNDETVKVIEIPILDDEEYEKNKMFWVELAEPRLVEMTEPKAMLLSEEGAFVKTDKIFKGHAIVRKIEGLDPSLLSTLVNFTDHRDQRLVGIGDQEARRIAEMGRPILGEHSKLEVIIEESYEFKSTVDKLIKKTNLAFVVGTHSWREQFIDALNVSAGDEEDDEESGEERLPSCFDYVMHFLSVFWKVLFAFMPPTHYCNGWACFVVSILMIGFLTTIIGDLASHFGCTIGLKDSVTAVVFVALGTSVPDTFASKISASQDLYADASVGNVTGSNAVNVFLGIGLAWTIAAVFWTAKGEKFHVNSGSLAFSVTLYTIFAFIIITVLLYRRRPSIGGELGGPRASRIMTSGLFVSLWVLYIVFVSLEAYCHIEGF